MSNKKRIFILGVNGFIGNALAEKILRDSGDEISGIDINSYNIERLFKYKKFGNYKRFGTNSASN